VILLAKTAQKASAEFTLGLLLNNEDSHAAMRVRPHPSSASIIQTKPGII
jgi:hypothetical protein